jgi:hypothetical protein
MTPSSRVSEYRRVGDRLVQAGRGGVGGVEVSGEFGA